MRVKENSLQDIWGAFRTQQKKNTKDEHFLCTAKQKSYNLLKSKIVNSLSSAIKNDALI